MSDWLDKRFAGTAWDLAAAPRPWGDRPALAAFVASQLDAEGARLPDSGVALPDEDRVAQAEGMRFASGARDGIALYHMAAGEEPEASREVLDLLWAVLADGGPARLPALYEAMVEHRALDWLDGLAPRLSREPRPEADRVYALGLLLASGAADREPVKAGIALMGMIELSEEDLELLRLLGRHDEFTLFSVVALSARAREPDLEQWDLARRVTGWGRVHAVRSLTRSERPEIMDWLLREGFHNDVMDRYLALSCAEAGDLAQALVGPVDDELLAGATGILSALLEPAGPTAGMEAWEEGGLAVGRWLACIAARVAPPLSAVPVLARIVAAADEEDGPWPPDVATPLAARARDLLAAPAWADRARAALETDGPDFEEAIAAAQALGIDTFEAWLRRLDPGRARPWAGAVAAAGQAERLDRVLDRALTLLPPDLLAQEDPRAYAPTTPAGSILSTLLQALTRAPGKGPGLILTGLHSPLVQHRNLALRALVAWPQGLWPEGAHERVAHVALHDPEESVRHNAQAAWGGAADA